MRVVTLDKSAFNEACIDLAKQITERFRPDIVIGVLTGGDFVGRIVFDNVKQDGTKYATVKIQRKSTQKKENVWVKKTLKCLPTCIANVLRLLEHTVLAWKMRNGEKQQRVGEVLLTTEIDCFLKERGKRVLIVDDAIDSGVTLQILKTYLESTYSVDNIQTAVITVTTKKPVIFPDYCLYNDETLIRFPWSYDFKG